MDGSHCRPDQLDFILYTGNDIHVEDLTRYKQHGLHPVVLGDKLPKQGTCVEKKNEKPRYRVLLKLGYGAFATVWLARDLFNKRYVSLKVCEGTDAAGMSNEASILSKLAKVEQNTTGHGRIITLLDSFTIKGPNGFHQCLVTEVISPLSDPDVIDRCSSETIHQILQGFSFLHEQGIAHGDPHLANMGVALPQLEQFSEDDITEYFANPEVIPVVPRDEHFPLNSVPPYITPCVSIADFLRSRDAFPDEPTLSIRIFDFGRAHWINDKPATLPGSVPEMVRPPEVVIYDKFDGAAGSVWSKAADIWAVGCMAYQIASGGQLLSTWGTLDDYLLRAFQLGGPPPDTWPAIHGLGSGSGNSFTLLPSRDVAWEEREARHHPSRCTHDGTRRLLRDLVKKMVVTNPEERTPLVTLLEHPFFAVTRLQARQQYDTEHMNALNGPATCSLVEELSIPIQRTV